MTTVRVDLTKSPVQARAFRMVKPGNRICHAWGRGVGKSWYARVLMYLLVSEWDSKTRETVDGPLGGVRIVLLFPTLEQFKRIGMAQGLVDDLSPGGQWGFLGAAINRTDWRITFPGGSWIQVVSATKINSNRGIRCDVLVADEADDIDTADYESVCIPWFSQPFSLDIRILGGTPRRGRYGLLWKAFRVWPEGEPGSPPVPNHYAFHATYADAPLVVKAELVEEARRTTAPGRFAREWLCDFDAGEGLVYPMFSSVSHVREPDYGVPYSEILVGVDHGWNDPGVILVAGVIGQGRDATVHLLEEVYETAKDTTWWVDRAAEIAWKYRSYRQRWYADPSRPDRIVDIRKGVRSQRPQIAERFSIDEADNAIEAGVDALANLIVERESENGERTARFYVSRACENTIREFGIYRRKRDPRNDDRVLDDIVDRDNHAMDAARYLVFTRFGGPDRARHEIGPHTRQPVEPA